MKEEILTPLEVEIDGSTYNRCSDVFRLRSGKIVTIYTDGKHNAMLELGQIENNSVWSLMSPEDSEKALAELQHLLPRSKK